MPNGIVIIDKPADCRFFDSFGWRFRDGDFCDGDFCDGDFCDGLDILWLQYVGHSWSWYRFASGKTACMATYGWTVIGIEGWEMDSGILCEIP